MLTDPSAAIFLSQKAGALVFIFPLPSSIIAAEVVSCVAADSGWCSDSITIDGIDAVEELADIVVAFVARERSVRKKEREKLSQHFERK